jgi:Secretion system C-terminal sorting domain
MFPGDANNDGIANQFDLLPIGVAYGSEGFPRPGAEPTWQPQFQPVAWPQNLPVSGINFAFLDSDGNGLVDSLDVDAIAFNFDSLQNASQPFPHPYSLADTCFSCPKPDLHISFDRDTAMVKDTFYALLTLRYPPNVLPQFGSLGIAFDLHYEPQNVKDDLIQVFPDTVSDDLMFVTATSTQASSWRAVPEGMIGFGASGKGQNAFFTPRPLGVVQIVVEDMVIRTFPVTVQFWLDASNFLIINELEQVVCLGSVFVDTILLYDPVNPAFETNRWEDGVSIYPNPSEDALYIHLPNYQLSEIEVLSATGYLLHRVKSALTNDVSLDVSSLAPGFYFLKLKTTAGLFIKKIKVK